MIRDTRVQYFLTFATLGTVLPYVPVFFRHAGLSQGQVGCAMAIYCLASMLSPVLVTMLADRVRDPRMLLGVVSLLTAVSLVLVARSHSVMLIMGVWTFYCLASMPVFPLQDGIHFSQQRRRHERGESGTPFHLIRVWGTIGYIVPSVILFRFLRRGMTLDYVLMTGAIWAALAGLQAFWLEDPRTTEVPPVPSPAESFGALPPAGGGTGGTVTKRPGGEARAATLGAARALFSPHLIAFTAAVVLMNMAGVVHSAFYPIYLTERVGLSDTWLGPASNVAVFFETFLLFSCGWLVRTVGLKRLLVFSMLAIALRMGLLGITTNVWVAVGTQVFHGFLVMAIGVLPQAIFNDSAEDRYRLSMQGVLVLVTSSGRAIASLLAGRVAGRSIAMAFNGTAIMCLLAAVLVIIGFFEHPLKVSGAVRDEDGDDPLVVGAASAAGRDD